jgi:PAS domain S-box-containing protein
MSKQFDSKKESVSLINRTYLKDNISVPFEKKYNDLDKKYKVLTERTKKLEDVYQFHKGIVQNISSGIVTVDFSGNITFINRAALKVVEYEYKDLINQPMNQLFADLYEAEEIFTDLLKNKKMFESKEVNLVTKTNKIIPIGFSTSNLQSNDSKFEGVVLLFRDLTNLINFRTQMERMERLATLGEVSAGIAHEIRNPLAGIKTSAQVLEESFSPNDFRAQLVSRIVKEIDRSNELLKKFFRFAKPSRPQQDFIDIEKIIESVHLLLVSRMKKRKIQFKSEYMPELPKVFVDESQIEQVVVNLILNAMDSIEKTGDIIVTTTLSKLNTESKESNEEEMVLVKIQDSGKGIEDEIIEKIFNPFFTTKNEGVGMGLAISSRLVEENGGRLEVNSEIGKGSSFSLYLPI